MLDKKLYIKGINIIKKPDIWNIILFIEVFKCHSIGKDVVKKIIKTKNILKINDDNKKVYKLFFLSKIININKEKAANGKINTSNKP